MSQSDLPAVNRRTVFAGAGALGALGAVVAVAGLPKIAAVAPVLVAQADAAAKAAQNGGYQLTDHVKQYYATARI